MTILARILFFLALTGRIASADPFQDHVNAGDEAHRNKQYAKARAEYQEAYDLRGEPIILYRIAQTYRMEENAKDALTYYRRYLTASQPTDDYRKNAEDYIAGLEAKLAAANPPVVPDAKPDVKPDVVPPKPPPPREEAVRHRHIPLASKISAGVAGAGLVSTLVFAKIGLSAEHDLHANPNATRADADRVERDQDLINLSIGVTAAAAATAVVLYIAAPSYTTERRTIVVGPLRDGGWAASFGGRF